jgi:hypothetical protein
MKARITVIFATVVVALSIVAGASAGSSWSSVRGSDYFSHAPASASWSGLKPGNIKAWATAGWTRARV